MKHCPSCQHEYDTKFCPRCGVAGTAALDNSTIDPPAASSSELLSVQPAPPVGSNDLSSQTPAQRVILLAEREQEGGAEAGAPEVVREPAPAPPARPAAEAVAPRRPRGSSLQRSIRMLALTNAVSSVLMMAGAVGLALIFSSAIERSSDRERQHKMELEKVALVREQEAAAREAEKNAALKEFVKAVMQQRPEAKPQPQPQQLSQADIEKMVDRKVAGKVSKFRYAWLSAPLSPDENKSIKNAVGQLIAKKTTVKTKRHLSSFKQTLLAGNPSRKVLYDKAKEVWKNIDDQKVRDDFRETIMDPLAGE